MSDFFDNIDSSALTHEPEEKEIFVTDKILFVSTYISANDDKFNDPEFVTSVIKKRLDATDFKAQHLKFRISTMINVAKKNIYTEVRINGTIYDSIDGFKLLWALNYGVKTVTKKNCVITFPMYFESDINSLIVNQKLENVVLTASKSYMFDNDIIFKHSKQSDWQYNVPLDTEEIAKLGSIICDKLLTIREFEDPYSEILKLYSYCGYISGLIYNNDIIDFHIRATKLLFDNNQNETVNSKNRMLYREEYPVSPKSISIEKMRQIEEIIRNSTKRIAGIDDVLRIIYMDDEHNWCKRSLYFISKERKLYYADNSIEDYEFVCWKGFPEQNYSHKSALTVDSDRWYVCNEEPEDIYDDVTNMFIKNIDQIKKHQNNVIRKLSEIKDGWHTEFDCIVDEYNSGNFLFVIHIGEVVDYHTCTIISASLGLYGTFDAIIENIKHLFCVQKVKVS